MNEMTLRLELFAQDHSALADFYCRVLNFDRISEEPDYIAVQNGGVTLGLGPQQKLSPTHYFDAEALRGRKGAGVEIVLEVDDIDRYHQRVIERGYPIQTPLKERPWGTRDFRIVDPEGYFLRITSKK
jgi:uncharacterized glyoxalase superfamily protein PhnB